jgi:hypothetical protein
MNKPNIFLAYEWSTPFSEMYKKLVTEYKKNWNFRFGPNSTTTPKELGEFEKFRQRNKQLFDQFVTNIDKSDIFIADVTSNNSNVLLELGIAIKLNKNILVVSGTSKEKTPFNIRGIEIEYYKSSEELKNKISDYLDTYQKIKNMNFGQKISGNYYSIQSGTIMATEESISTGHVKNAAEAFRIVHIPIEIPKLRDCKLKVEYKIRRRWNSHDWFGFMFRSAEEKGGFEPNKEGSILVNSRANGKTDLTIYPGLIIPKTDSTHLPHDGKTYRTLEIHLNGRLIKIIGDTGNFEYDSLANLNFGYLYLVCFRSDVEYKNLEIINTNTTSEVIF